jgi:hypothetical protein
MSVSDTDVGAQTRALLGQGRDIVPNVVPDVFLCRLLSLFLDSLQLLRSDLCRGKFPGNRMQGIYLPCSVTLVCSAESITLKKDV